MPPETDLYLSSSAFIFEDLCTFFFRDQNTVPVIFDTGAILAITHGIDDLIYRHSLYIGSMVDGLEVPGIVQITWTFELCDPKEVQIITDGNYFHKGSMTTQLSAFN